jgi:flagellar export protein FliJ
MKRKFRFRLEAVEKVRRAKEQQTLRDLAFAQAKYQEAIRAKQALMDDTDLALRRRQQLAATAQPVLAYQLETEYITGNKQRMIQSDQAIFRARKVMEKALKEVILAKRALRAIELLREKAYAEFKIEVRKKEQKETEDLYTSRRSLSEIAGLESETDTTEWSESA